MENFNLNYEPSKKNKIKTLIGLLIFHYFIFFQSHDHFFSFIVLDRSTLEDTRIGILLYKIFSRKIADIFHIIISFSLLYFYWHFRKKITCFFEELIKKFIQKI